MSIALSGVNVPESRSARPNTPSYRDALAFASVSQRERAVAGVLAACCAISVCFVAPFSARQAPEIGSFVPVVSFVTAFAMALTATLLFSQYHAVRNPPLAYLGYAYAASATLIVAHSIAYPFGGSQTAAWLLSAWHVAFLVLACGFVVAEWLASRAPDWMPLPRFSFLLLTVAVVVAVAGILDLTIGHASGLPIIAGVSEYTAAWRNEFAPVILGLNMLVLAALIAVTRLETVVALWLAVVLCATLAETVVLSLLPSARFSYGWYFARGEWIVAATAFYFALQLRITHILAMLTASNRELFEKALSDELTGLLNKRGFDARLERAARDSELTGDVLTIVAIDVDEFKPYNDGFGHPAGDRALAAIGAVLKSVGCRREDFCGRIGGEEFAIVLAGTDLPASLAVAERARQSVEALKLFHVTGASHASLTISVGVASNESEPTLSTVELMARADAALYDAKASGRNCTRVAKSAVSPVATSEVA